MDPQLTIRHCHRHSRSGQRVATVRVRVRVLVRVLVLVRFHVLVRPSVRLSATPSPANPFSGPLSCLGFQSFLMLPGSTGQRDCEGKAPEGPSRRSHVTDGWVDVEDHTMAIAFALTHTLAR